MNEAVFHDIYGYEFVPFWQTRSFIITILILLLILASIAAYFIVCFIRQRRLQASLLTAWEWAQAELKKLEASVSEEKEACKQFYFQLTQIIKDYFYRRYGWQLLDKTDE